MRSRLEGNIAELLIASLANIPVSTQTNHLLSFPQCSILNCVHQLEKRKLKSSENRE